MAKSVLKFAKNTKMADILPQLVERWKAKHIDVATGKLANNNYAPIWFYVGAVRKMACRGTGDDSAKLLVFAVSHTAELPTPRTVWE